MMETSQSLMRIDAFRSYGATSTVWCSLPQSKMRAVFVVVTNVFREKTFQMSLTNGYWNLQPILRVAIGD